VVCISSLRLIRILIITYQSVYTGFDVILQISEMQVDEKARPLVPVVIEHCGELVLQKPAAKAKAPVTSGQQPILNTLKLTLPLISHLIFISLLFRFQRWIRLVERRRTAT